MSDSEATSTQTDLDALRALQADASRLERVEKLLSRFNVFETIGFVSDELMHSRFLAFLLDPKRNDGLSDLFLKALLRQALSATQETLPHSVFEDLVRVAGSFDSMDFRRTIVRREHQNIDILLTNDAHKLAVIIENKTWTTEHSGQLDKYDRIVRHNHPGWAVLKIYLTPYRDPPRHKEYVAFGYAMVCAILDEILKDHGSSLDLDLRMSIEHYVRMVRRRILGDPELVRLCQDIYQRHGRAIDLVYRHRPDVRTKIRPIIEELIRQHPKLKQEGSSIDTLRFGVTTWDTDALLTAEGWTKTKRILMFVIYNTRSSLDLHLFLGPGPETTREKIFIMVRANSDVFLMPNNTNPRWLSIFHRPLLMQEAYENLDEEKREEEIRLQWREFIESDLPRIDKALRAEPWIWKSVEADPEKTERPEHEA